MIFPFKPPFISGVSSIFTYDFPMKTSISFGDFQAMIDDAHRVRVSMGSRAEAEACPTAWPPRSIMVGRTGNLEGIFPGWRLSHPSEKFDFVSWELGWWHSPYIMENKIHVPNHQPVSYEWRKGFTQFYDVQWCSMKIPNVQNPKWHWFFWRNLDFLTDIQKCRRRLAYDKNWEVIWQWP